MCYNTTTSLITFAVMAISTIFLIYRNYPNDRWVAIFFISTGIMQLLEYFMWKDQACGKMNHNCYNASVTFTNNSAHCSFIGSILFWRFGVHS